MKNMKNRAVQKIALALCAVLALFSVGCSGGGGTAGTSSVPDESTSAVPESSGTISSAPDSTTEPKEDTELLRSAEKYLKSITGRRGYTVSGSEPYYIGRWFDKTVGGKEYRVTLASGSSLHFAVNGTERVKVRFEITTLGSTPYYAVSTDGGEFVRGAVNGCEITLPDTGWHTIDLYCDGMNHNEDKWNLESGYAISSIDCGNGKLVGIKPDGKLILFYGDSITEGIRAVIPSSIASDSNSAVNTYAYYCCEKLGANIYPVGYGGTGIINEGFFATLDKTIDNFSSKRKADNSFTPDAVIINHGTNDVNIDGAEFISGYRSAVEKIHGLFPGAPVFAMIPFNQEHSADIREAVSGLDYVSVIETDGWGITYNDNVHPNIAGAMNGGERLAGCLTGILGEDWFTK